MSTAKTESQTIQPAEAEPQLRDLFSFSAGDRTFAVFAEDVEGIAESKRAAPLPHAPPAVLGVISVRGRMLTVLDAAALLASENSNWPAELPFVIALRGDEQLALAADSVRETITIASTDIEPVDVQQSDRAQTVVVGIARHGGEELTILNSRNLFSAAFQRTERRRRRF